MNDQTETSISLVDLFKILWKRVIYIIGTTLLGLIFGVIYANSFLTAEYTASGTFIINRAINTAMLNTATEVAKSTDVLELALISLEEEEVTNNGEDLTVGFLRNGLSVSSTTNVPSIKVAFVSENSEFNHLILNAIIESAVTYGNENYSVFTESLIVGELATASTYSGQSKTLYYAIGVLLGGVIGVGGVLLITLLSGKVQLISSYNNYGIPYNHMKTNFKVETDKTIDDLVLKLQNKVEANKTTSLIKVLGFISPEGGKEIDIIIRKYAENYANNGLKVLVMDLDLTKSKSDQSLFMYTNKNTIVDYHDSGVIPEEIEIKKNLHYVEGGVSLFPSRILKDDSFNNLFVSYKEKYDLILIKLAPNSSDDSYLVAGEMLDTLVINVILEKTPKKQIEQIVNNNLVTKKTTLYLNFIEKKPSLPKFLKTKMYIKNKKS